jgi:outer membrane protein OmpA-like peptidoglycan-associated protein
LGLLLGALGCARAAPQPGVMREVDSARQSAAVVEAQARAPQAYADAELRRKQAAAAEQRGDLGSAQILSEQALAAYTRAVVQARLARAQASVADEETRAAKASAQLSELQAQEQRVRAEAEDLEAREKVARDALPLPSSGPASKEREQARLVAARALLTQAKLLCLSARLLDPSREAVTGALGKLAELSQKLTLPAPIDDATALRSTCLRELVLVRRPITQKSPAAGAADALLAELSAASLTPVRDDRGVVVTLRALFDDKSQLKAEGLAELDMLGKVAKAHPDFPLLAVLHSARGANPTRESAEASAVAETLRKAGAPKVETDAVGASAPVVDPERPGAAERNRRVEIVFVSPTSS